MFNQHRETTSTTDNPTVYAKLRRLELGCPCCPPNRGDNGTTRSPRHDRYKSARKGRCSGARDPIFRETAGGFTRIRQNAPPRKRIKRAYWWMIAPLR